MMEVLATFLADTLVLIHIAVVLFVVFGGLLALRWRWVMGLHLPAVLWGALVEFFSWECPLTPLENELRHRAAQGGYEGGFVEHYLIPVLYPAAMGRDVHVMLGLLVVVLNVWLYGWALGHAFRTAKGPSRLARIQARRLR